MKKLLLTIFIYTPFFWFFELLQNLAYKLTTGEYGWVYPTESSHWFSFRTLPSWGIALAVMLFVDKFFRAKNYNLWTICLTAGSICWGLEWCNGFLWAEILQQPLYVWTFSPLKYVGIEAIILWCLDVWVLLQLVKAQKN